MPSQLLKQILNNEGPCILIINNNSLSSDTVTSHFKYTVVNQLILSEKIQPWPHSSNLFLYPKSLKKLFFLSSSPIWTIITAMTFSNQVLELFICVYLLSSSLDRRFILIRTIVIILIFYGIDLLFQLYCNMQLIPVLDFFRTTSRTRSPGHPDVCHQIEHTASLWNSSTTETDFSVDVLLPSQQHLCNHNLNINVQDLWSVSKRHGLWNTKLSWFWTLLISKMVLQNKVWCWMLKAVATSIFKLVLWKLDSLLIIYLPCSSI